jgi:tripartite ATP-independent transporter DctM subunit
MTRKLALLKQLIAPGILGIIVIGSIYAGIATPTEAAAIGCLGALVAAALNQKLSVESVKISLFETMKVTAMLSWLFFSAQTIIGVYTLAGGDLFVKNAVTAVPFGRWGAIVAMQLILIFLGMFLDWVGILLLTMPLFVPIILEQGFSNVWFGVVFCMNMHISYLTPPFAPSAFYMKSVVPEGITMGDIYRSILPYLILTVAALILVILFPEISLWLPAQMGGK